MILSVCANASLDRTAVVPGYAIGKLHRIDRVHSQAGGKGINVARTLKAFGIPVLTTGFVGGQTGRTIVQSLRTEGISAEMAAIAGESRSCFAVVDTKGLRVTEIDELGPEISLQDLRKLTGVVAKYLGRARIAIFSGSLPPGAPPETYRKWAEMAWRSGTRPIVDAAGASFAEALDARPFMIKPNEGEAEEFLGWKPDTHAAINRALDKLVSRADVVALTLGGRGAAFAAGDRRWRASPPPVNAINTVGCGDAFLAGFVAGLVRNLPLEDASRLAVAAGTANSIAVGAGSVPVQTIERLENEVVLSDL